jgi:hypothetical protein
MLTFTTYTIAILYGQYSIFLKNLTTEQIEVLVAPYVRIREVLGSGLGRYTGYPVRGFLWYSSVPPGKYRASTSIRARPFPSQNFIIHHSPNVPITWLHWV